MFRFWFKFAEHKLNYLQVHEPVVFKYIPNLVQAPVLEYSLSPPKKKTIHEFTPPLTSPQHPPIHFLSLNSPVLDSSCYRASHCGSPLLSTVTQGPATLSCYQSIAPVHGCMILSAVHAAAASVHLAFPTFARCESLCDHTGWVEPPRILTPPPKAGQRVSG